MFDEQVLLGLQDELRKLAFSPVPALASVGKAIQRGAGIAGSGAGMGAIAGGVLGAGAKGYQEYQQGREQGQGVASSLAGALPGAMRGALPGAVAGAALGGVGGAAIHARNPQLAASLVESSKRVPILGAGARFGQSQAHLLTGWKPKGGLAELGLGQGPAAEQLLHGQLRLQDVQQGVPSKTRLGRLFDKLPYAEARAKMDVNRLDKHFVAAQDAERRGMTSIPGYVGSLAKDPLGTLGTAFRQRWHGSGPVGKALMFGLPTAMGVQAIRADDPTKGTAERILGAGGNVLGSFATAPMNMLGDSVIGMGLGSVGAGVGRHIDRFAGFKPKLVTPQAGEGQAVESLATQPRLRSAEGGA